LLTDFGDRFAPTPFSNVFMCFDQSYIAALAFALLSLPDRPTKTFAGGAAPPAR
jgi:hypothetical protein